MKLFDEERKVLEDLLREWYAAMKDVQKGMDLIFSTKAKLYDKDSPVWERIRWPHGFVQEIRKKSDRIDQLLGANGGFEVSEVRWDEVEEELLDIANYCRMFAAITRMVQKRLPTPEN